MTQYSSTVSVSSAVLLPVLALLAGPAPVRANSLTVGGGAAMGGTGFGLRVTLDDPAMTAPNDAWVSIGPDKGMLGETSILGGFLLDVSGLTVGPGGLRFLRFYDQLGAGGERVVFFLEKVSSGSWQLGAWTWDDTMAQLVLAGQGALPGPCPPPAAPSTAPGGLSAGSSFACPETGPSPVLAIEFEWQAAATPGTGRLSVFARPIAPTQAFAQPTARRVAIDSTVVLHREDLDNASQSLSYMQLGVLAAEHPAQTFGDLSLDEIAVRR